LTNEHEILHMIIETRSREAELTPEYTREEVGS